MHVCSVGAKGCILLFPKKGDLGLAKNYRGITLTSIAAKIYNALLRNCIVPQIDKILRKNQNGFRRNRCTTSQILTIRRILEGVRAKKKLQATLLFVDFTKAFDSIHRGENGINSTSIRPTRRNRSSNNDSLQKHQSESAVTGWRHRILRHCSRSTTRGHASPIPLYHLSRLRTSIDNIRENGFVLTRKRSRRYPAKTITDADYADDIALLVNTPNQAETLLHSLERAAAGIGLHVNAHKTEFIYQKGDISTLDGTSLKLVDKFTYLGSSVSSTEKDIDTRLTKAWIAIDHMEIKPDR